MPRDPKLSKCIQCQQPSRTLYCNNCAPSPADNNRYGKDGVKRSETYKRRGISSDTRDISEHD